MDTSLLEQVSKLTFEEQQAVEKFIQELLSKHSSAEVETVAEKRKKNMGRMKGEIWMADDFNETPEDFKDYL